MNATKKQDIYTRDEVAQIIIPRLTRGKYQIDVSDNGEMKVSTISNRWLQREDVEQIGD
jgi:hypothetical protein